MMLHSFIILKMFLKSGWSCCNFLYEWLKLCQFVSPTENSMAKSEELSTLYWRTPNCQSTENNLVWRMSVSNTIERLLFLRQSLFPSSEVTTTLETISVSITGKWSTYCRMSICPLSINDRSWILQRWSLNSYTLF